MSPEEDLIERVLAIKSSSVDPLTAAQVHAKLTTDGVQVELSQVKKAASKAAKRVPTTLPAAPVAVPAPAAGISKQEAKRAAVATDALKAAELAVMTALKSLHHERWMVALHGTAEDTKAFLDRAAKQAICGSLDDGEPISKERVEADVVTLQYVLLAGSPFKLPDGDRSAAKAQLEKLESFRSMPTGRLERPFVSQPTFQGFRQNFVFKTGALGLGYYHEGWFAAASTCYVAPSVPAAPAEPQEDMSSDSIDPAMRDILNERHLRGGVQSKQTMTSSLDKAMAKASMLAAAGSAGTGSAMDEMD